MITLLIGVITPSIAGRGRPCKMSRGVSVRAIGGGDKLQTKREIEMGDTQRYFRQDLDFFSDDFDG